MRSRVMFLVMAFGFATAAQAELVQAPALLVYAPNLLGQYVGAQGRLPLQGALPMGSGSAIAMFAQLLGLIAVWKALSSAWTIANTSSSAMAYSRQDSWGGCFFMFLAGICVFHLEKTMAMLAATIPGFPDLTPILRY